jgi:hypothetical protein
MDEIGRKLWQATVLTVRPAKFDSRIPALDKTALSKPLPERSYNVSPFASGRGV